MYIIPTLIIQHNLFVSQPPIFIFLRSVCDGFRISAGAKTSGQCNGDNYRSESADWRKKLLGVGTKWLHIRKHFWDEVKVNVDTFDDYLETIIGLRQEAQALSVSQSTDRHASKKLSAASPYAGGSLLRPNRFH